MIEFLNLMKNKSWITKSMMDSIPYMLRGNSYTFRNFFERCIYETPLMQRGMEINIKSDSLDHFFFTSNTSLITKEQILKELCLEEIKGKTD
jgi:hypothetical protein